MKAYEAGGFVQKSITLWNSLLYRVTDPIQPTQFYPAGRTFDTTPQAERGLYGYSLLIPTENGNIKRNNVKTDDGVRARPPRVNNIISRNDLGDPNYYPGPIAMDLPTLQEMIQEYNNPYTPAYMKQNILRGLDKWAKPGSRNRRTLQGLGIPLV